VHINAHNLDQLIQPKTGATMSETISLNLRAISDQATKLRRSIHGQVNHPNFGWAITAADLAEVPEARFVEIYNGHPSIRQLGDKTHPSVEQIWDIANSLRIRQNQPPLMGVAVDDTHDYLKRGPGAASPGRGWIVVRAAELAPAAIFDAMGRGDFYASTGVVLKDVQYSPGEGKLTIEVEPDGDASYTIEFIGTRAAAAPTTQPSHDVGQILQTTHGPAASYTLEGDELYVRALITSDKPADNPSLPRQVRQAWTQPVGWEKRVR